MKTRSAKNKGRRCSKEAKELILRYLPVVQADDVIVTTSGETGEDLKLSPKARRLMPFQIECKAVEKLNIWEAIEQAKSHGSHIPLVVFKRNRTGLYACLSFEELMKLIYKVSKYDGKYYL